jgi:hypothetical protein
MGSSVRSVRRLGLRLSRAPAGQQHPLHLVLRDALLDGQADETAGPGGAVGGHAQHANGGGVDEHDPAIGARDHDTLLKLAEERFERSALAVNGLDVSGQMVAHLVDRLTPESDGSKKKFKRFLEH